MIRNARHMWPSSASTATQSPRPTGVARPWAVQRQTRCPNCVTTTCLQCMMSSGTPNHAQPTRTYHQAHRQPFCTLLVLELADVDLATFLDGMQRPLAPPLAKRIMQHIFRGLAACHAHGTHAHQQRQQRMHVPPPLQGVLHRDLKPSNVLAVQGCWKLGDFGQSRPEPQPGAPGRMSADVCTRWYRAPELLYGSRSYGAAVDMWAAGCIFAELLGMLAARDTSCGCML